MIKFLSPMFGSRVHEKDNDGLTMLHLAAQGGYCEVAQYVIEELKMDPQERDKVCGVPLKGRCIPNYKVCMRVCDANDHVPFFCRLNNLICCGNRAKGCTCYSLRYLSTVHNTGPYLLCGNALFTTDDLINRVEGQLLYDRVIDEVQIPVANICNGPHVVFSIVRPNYRVNVHRTGARYMGVPSSGN